MHVKVIINIVVCCQFDMHFSPHFEIFGQSGHGSKSCRAPSVHFKGFTASDSGSTVKCRVPACILRPGMLLFYPSVRVSLLSDNMRCFQRLVAASVPWMQFLRQFKQASRLNVMFLRGGLWPVGACAFHIQPAKRTLISNTKVASHLLSFYQSHCLQSGAWASPLLPTGVPTVSCVGKNSQSDCLPPDPQLQQLFLLKGLHLQKAQAV